MTPFDRVHSVEDYYDGPRIGIADFNGEPHHYRSLAWIHRDKNWDPDDDRFELVPVAAADNEPLVMIGKFHVRQPVPDLPVGVLRPLDVQWTAPKE